MDFLSRQRAQLAAIRANRMAIKASVDQLGEYFDSEASGAEEPRGFEAEQQHNLARATVWPTHAAPVRATGRSSNGFSDPLGQNPGDVFEKDAAQDSKSASHDSVSDGDSHFHARVPTRKQAQGRTVAQPSREVSDRTPASSSEAPPQPEYPPSRTEQHNQQQQPQHHPLPRQQEQERPATATATAASGLASGFDDMPVGGARVASAPRDRPQTFSVSVSRGLERAPPQAPAQDRTARRSPRPFLRRGEGIARFTTGSAAYRPKPRRPDSRGEQTDEIDQTFAPLGTAARAPPPKAGVLANGNGTIAPNSRSSQLPRTAPAPLPASSLRSKLLSARAGGSAASHTTDPARPHLAPVSSEPQRKSSARPDAMPIHARQRQEADDSAWREQKPRGAEDSNGSQEGQDKEFHPSDYHSDNDGLSDVSDSSWERRQARETEEIDEFRQLELAAKDSPPRPTRTDASAASSSNSRGNIAGATGNGPVPRTTAMSFIGLPPPSPLGQSARTPTSSSIPRSSSATAAFASRPKGAQEDVPPDSIDGRSTDGDSDTAGGEQQSSARTTSSSVNAARAAHQGAGILRVSFQGNGAHESARMQAAATYSDVHFDDESEWDDPTPSSTAGRESGSRQAPGSAAPSGQNADASAPHPTQTAPPPRSALVSRLFSAPPVSAPRPSTQSIAQQARTEQLLKAAADREQKQALRISELEKELQVMRKAAERARELDAEKDRQMKSLRTAADAVERERASLEQQREEEWKKIKKEKMLLETHRTALRERPDKKVRIVLSFWVGYDGCVASSLLQNRLYTRCSTAGLFFHRGRILTPNQDREEMAELRRQVQDLQERLTQREQTAAAAERRMQARMTLLSERNAELQREVVALEEQRANMLAGPPHSRPANANGVSGKTGTLVSKPRVLREQTDQQQPQQDTKQQRAHAAHRAGSDLSVRAVTQPARSVSTSTTSSTRRSNAVDALADDELSPTTILASPLE
jgi:hypothetical protein